MKTIICPECGEKHIPTPDYKEYEFGNICNRCNDIAHKKFLKKNPNIARWLEKNK